MGYPDPTVKPAREHTLPKSELELGNDFARAGMAFPRSLQFDTRIESGLFGVGQAQEEGVIPWPGGTVDELKRL